MGNDPVDSAHRLRLPAPDVTEAVASPLQIALLGSTGTIGRRTLDVVRDLGPERARISALVAHSRVELLRDQVLAVQPDFVGVTEETKRRAWADLWSAEQRAEPPTMWGEEALIAAATLDGVDTVVVATVGAVGVRATLAAVRLGRRVALANKEVLVCAGDLVMAAASEHGATILPIDSEHSAILQCLAGQRPEAVRRLILTASGGPFRGASPEEMMRATPAQALAHPTWRMGAKITIDSATMMNKGFEIIEAHHLFGIDPDRIEVVIHPESLIHSMVEFCDGSVIAQLSRTDMYLPILGALVWPERVPNPVPPLDFAALGRLTFEALDHERFPCVGLARRALAVGGTMPAVLNAANEVAVSRFLAGETTLPEIATLIGRAMDAHRPNPRPTLAEILAADRWARQEVGALCSSGT